MGATTQSSSVLPTNMPPILLQLFVQRCAPPARPARAVKQGLLCPLSVITHHCIVIQA